MKGISVRASFKMQDRCRLLVNFFGYVRKYVMDAFSGNSLTGLVPQTEGARAKKSARIFLICFVA